MLKKLRILPKSLKHVHSPSKKLKPTPKKEESPSTLWGEIIARLLPKFRKYVSKNTRCNVFLVG
jgi:hypothetical protein